MTASKGRRKLICGKVKVKLSLDLTKYHAMKTYVGIGIPNLG